MFVNNNSNETRVGYGCIKNVPTVVPACRKRRLKGNHRCASNSSGVRNATTNTNKKQGGGGLQADPSRNHPEAQLDPKWSGANGTTLNNEPIRTSEIKGERFSRSDIVGDGNCLFRVISLYLEGNQDNHQQIRANAVKYIQEHWTSLQIYI
ncbi:unnamed protein product [Ceutorhynchus assimilis]|uniref:OTU domain-containing protein n=1 Tax=Ceutorhynchus assimilis TaxID=467358 RepID=A0A9N9QRV6_9CUCU|nr:unnamed protein product [Ceutorhynchus assimilis]